MTLVLNKPASVSSAVQSASNRDRRGSCRDDWRGSLAPSADETRGHKTKIRQLEMENHALRWQLQNLRDAADESSPAPVLSKDRPLPGHQFGVRLIALCIELAKRIGFRATTFVVELFFQTLGIDLKVPSHDAVQQWTMRLGVAELSDTFDKDQRVLWMADHSSQIGREKVLLIIGMLVEDLPPPGQTLELEKLKVLAVVPGERWKREDVEREYQRLADKIGPPVYLLCDGAVELREPAEILVRDGKKAVVLRDLKHHAANLLEKQVGRSERFKAFLTSVGLTRSRIQQTELSHFVPPALKQKSRFMNLSCLLRWSTMVLHHLEHPESDARQDVMIARMEEKLGWLRDFKSELSQWRACQEVIDKALSWINHQGLARDSGDRLADLFESSLERSDDACSPAGQIAKKLLAFVAEAAKQIPTDERAWLSTEILESLFGRFKQLERQHSKGGFTRLLAALPALCVRADAQRIRTQFAKTKAQDVRQWIRDTLPKTLPARRNAAYREAFSTA